MRQGVETGPRVWGRRIAPPPTVGVSEARARLDRPAPGGGGTWPEDGAGFFPRAQWWGWQNQNRLASPEGVSTELPGGAGDPEHMELGT